MRRGRLLWGISLCCASFVACADILGISDGTPRDYDSSVPDVASDNTVLPDAFGPDASDAAVDAPIDLPTSPLACGTKTCNALKEGCCRTGSTTQADAQAFACVATAGACDGGLFVTCDEPVNCTAQGHPNDVCCAVLNEAGTIAIGTTCTSAGSCAGGVFVCEPGDDEMCKFDAGQSCKDSVSTIVGWKICK